VGALITPALFSHRPPPDREKREKFVRETLVGKNQELLFPLLSRSGGGRWERRG
jgi:hypothetical protein